MRKVASALLALLLLTACSGGSDGTSPDGESPSPQDAAPVRGEIDVSVEPLALAALPEAPEAGTGVAVVGEDTYSFAVTYCDASAPIGTGSGEQVEVAWDIRDDGDHRVNVRVNQGETNDGGNWVRGGPADAEWDEATGTLRFAGAFVPFRAEDGQDARSGGIVVVCPAEGE